MISVLRQSVCLPHFQQKPRYIFHKLGMPCNTLLLGCQLQKNENRLLLLKMHQQIILQEVPLKWKLPQRTFLQTGHCTSVVYSYHGQCYITHSNLLQTWHMDSQGLLSCMLPKYPLPLLVKNHEKKLKQSKTSSTVMVKRLFQEDRGRMRRNSIVSIADY